jgi:hypothetical protein
MDKRLDGGLNSNIHSTTSARLKAMANNKNGHGMA